MTARPQAGSGGRGPFTDTTDTLENPHDIDTLPLGYDPRLPANRPLTGTQARRRIVLGGEDLRRPAEDRRTEPPVGLLRAPGRARADRGRLHPRVVLTLRPGSRRNSAPGGRPSALRGPHGLRSVLLARPGRRRDGALGDDEVVRHELPLPGAGNRPGHAHRPDGPRGARPLRGGPGGGRERQAGPRRPGDVARPGQGRRRGPRRLHAPRPARGRGRRLRRPPRRTRRGGGHLGPVRRARPHLRQSPP
mgnify:CR=1 FL=1